MKNAILLFLIYFFNLNASAQNVTIIESQSSQPEHIMDTVWNFVANNIGYNPSIVPQVTLDTISNLSTTDILIISSANVTASSAQQIQTVVDFVLSGRSVYIQAEYQTSFLGSIAFDTIMQALGVNFSWTTSESGDLSPMNVLGSLSTTPNNVNSLNYFWYGLAGSGGAEIENFMLYNENYFGFIYSDSTSSNGTVITVSDKDWIKDGISLDLMENILHRLNSQINIGVMENNFGNELLIYPNPTSYQITINNKHFSTNQIHVVDLWGKKVKFIKPNTNVVNVAELPSGVYFIIIANEERTITKKFVKQ